LNVEEGDDFHFNLRISPSSVIGSKVVNEILSNLKIILKEKEEVQSWLAWYINRKNSILDI
jgi:hypothetical protein